MPNSAPTDILVTGDSISESAGPGALVATLAADDPDVGDTFTFALTDVPASTLFEIVGNTIRVKAGANIDYETTKQHVLTVQVTDSANNTFSEPVTINVLDANEITGTPFDDPALNGTLGDDIIDALAGNDVVDGSAGNDLIYGREGNDSLQGGFGADTIYGGADQDSLYGGSGNDTLDGEAGDDSLSGDAGSDTLIGGDGNDNLQDYSTDGTGNNSLQGGAGNDQLYVNAYGSPSGGNSLDGGSGNDYLQMQGYGSASLSGGDGNDYLQSYANYDGSARTLDGGAGDDVIQSYYSSGQTLTGGDGNDQITVSGGSGSLDAGAGDDALSVGSFSGTIALGTGNDTLNLQDRFVSITVTDFTTGVGGDKIDLTSILNQLSGYDGSNPFGPSGYLQLVQDGTGTLLQIDADGAASNGSVFSTLITFQNTAVGDLAAGNFTPAYPLDGSPIPGLTITGTPGDDQGATQLNGTLGDDIIDALAGNDVVDGSAGNDLIYGREGNDSLQGGFGADTIYGGADQDSLYGGSGNDTLDGEAGDDSLSGDAGSDTLIGGDGNDNLQDYSTDGTGNNSLQGGAGNDQLYVNAYGSPSGGNSLDGGSGNDYLQMQGYGSASLSGGDGNDYLQSYANYDGSARTLDGGAGDDVIQSYYSSGQTLTGGDGNDQITVSGGSGSLDAGAGDDALSVGSFSGTIALGTGNDTLNLQDRFVSITVTDFATGASGDKIDLTSILNQLSGYDGSNPFGPSGYLQLVQDGTGTLLQIDADGAASNGSVFSTLITFQNTAVGDLAAGNFTPAYPLDGSPIPGLTITGTPGDDQGATQLNGTLGDDIIDALAGNDVVDGSAGNDLIYGREGNDSLQGGFGADTIYGGADQDSLYGGSGNDTLDGEAGDDSLSGDAGSDTLIGGDGNDNLQDYSTDGTGNNSLQGGAGNDQLYVNAYGSPSGGNSLDGGSGNDYLQMQGYGSASLSGGDGNDYLQSYANYDGSARTLDGGAGDDVIQSYYSSGQTLTGGDGNDQITVSGGSGSLDAGAGDDALSVGSFSGTIALGTGNDTLNLQDRFVSITVTDFATGASGDKIDLTNLLNGLSGYTGTNPFDSGFLRIVQSGADTLLRVDADGAVGGSVFTTLVRLQNTTATSLTADNFTPSFAPEGGLFVNIPPVLTGNLAATIDEGAVYVLAAADLGFTDPEDGQNDVTFTVSNFSNGTVLVGGSPASTFNGQQLADGLVSFKHNGSETTAASFDVFVEDGDEDVTPPTTSTFQFTVNPVNDPPALGDDSAYVDEGQSVVTTNVLDNDSDPDNTLTAANIVSFTQGTYGSVISNNDGTFNYSHDGTDNFADSFTYTVDDGAGGVATATVYVSINPSVPILGNDSATVDEGASVTTINVLTNDSDEDTTLTAANIYSYSGAAHGSVVYNGDGTFTYTHDGSETTSDNFTYYVDNLAGGYAAATVEITINPVNDAPVVTVANAVTLISQTPGGSSGSGESYPYAISADGHFVTFYSNASNLVAGDNNGTTDAFLYDTQTGTVSLLSATPGGTSGNSYSYPTYHSAFSADSHFVTFQSYASDLVAGDNNGNSDAFLYDTQTGTVSLISQTPGGTSGNGYSYPSAISADGRFVTFYSNASDLSAGDTNGTSDAFLYDTETGAVSLISQTTGGTSGNGNSYPEVISGDGRFMAFYSNASDLVTSDNNGSGDVFLYDSQTQTVSLVSHTSGGSSGSGESYPYAISADGHFVTFYSNASNLVAGDNNGTTDAFLYDTQTGTVSLLSATPGGTSGNSYSYPTYHSAFSADSHFVTFQSYASDLVAGDNNGNSDAFLYDTQTGTVSLISQTPGGTSGNGYSYPSAISADGRFVTFYSNASVLSPGDNNGTTDAFLYDTQTGTVSLISQTGGTSGNSYSYPEVISGDGRFVAFYSQASDLVAGDNNNTGDAFLYDRQGGGPLTFTENDPALAVAPGLNIVDPDSTTLAFATVSVSANYVQGEDVLSFTPAGGITGNFNSMTGTLTLTGPATLADWQTALRSVTYLNTSEDPSAVTRTISFQVDDGASINNLSNLGTRDIDVIPVGNTNTAPTADPIIVSVDEDLSYSTNLLTAANADDDDDDVLSVANPAGTIVTSRNRTLVLGTDYEVVLMSGLFSLTAAGIAQFNSLGEGVDDTFLLGYQVTDGHDPIANTLTLTIHGKNDAPTANDDLGAGLGTQAGTLLTIDDALLLGNDTDPDTDPGDTHTITSVQGAAHGAVSLSMSGDVLFTPTFGYVGPASFQYSISDGNGGSSTAEVSIDVTAYSILGTPGNDKLTGTEDADLIDAGKGNDIVNAGDGNDIFKAHKGDGNDTYDGGAGSDTLDLSEITAAVRVRLGMPVSGSHGRAEGTQVVDDTLISIENVISGSGNDILHGNDVMNYIDGGAGNDTILGFGDVDTLVGGSGIDSLDGGTGADQMAGGLGNDTYIVDNAGDKVTETTAGAPGGTDLVKSSVTFILSDNIENLTLTGTAAINGTGNAGANTILGNSGANTLDGGIDSLATIVDQLKGGAGNDTYIVREVNDKVTELAGQGTDTVKSDIDYVLVANVENLLLQGSAALNGTGNTLANAITGNSGANTLNGMAGKDTLTGGADADMFVFSTKLSATTNLDTITDFGNGADAIHLDNAIFTKLGAAGPLNPDFFKSGAGAVAGDTNDHIIYNTTTGILSYDSNGNVAGGSVQFAILTGAPALTVGDFDII